MLGIGTKNTKSIILTDPDSIELSNLSWQFLFKEKNIGQSKALVSAKSIIMFNQDYKDKVQVY